MTSHLAVFSTLGPIVTLAFFALPGATYSGRLQAFVPAPTLLMKMPVSTLRGDTPGTTPNPPVPNNFFSRIIAAVILFLKTKPEPAEKGKWLRLA